MTHPSTHTHLHNMIFTEKKICQRRKNAREKGRKEKKKKMPGDLMHAIASLLSNLGWCTQTLGQSDYSVC